jgi:murein DD-endopeptidase MepM/ murein hydrolase activator NlpD
MLAGVLCCTSPLNGTYRVTAYFDHQNPNYVGDDYIWIYNGERVSSSYANKTGEPYPYDGHDGWDWALVSGTDVLAAAAGTVEVSTDSWAVVPCYGRTIVINHGNGYYTQYSHLNERLVQQGTSVAAGQLIARSGNSAAPQCPVSAHLHFGVRQDGYLYTTYATDPFGWRGSQRDPLFNYNNKESSCLWAGVPGDSISCADIIVEDDGAGWSQNGLGPRVHRRQRLPSALDLRLGHAQLLGQMDSPIAPSRLLPDSHFHPGRERYNHKCAL